jgi:glycine cleavage system aminomethyltransferase T
MPLLHKLNGGSIGDFKFFSMGETKIAGRTLQALRHGMGGAPGLEFWGPVEEGAEVKAAILETGEQFDCDKSAVAHTAASRLNRAGFLRLCLRSKQARRCGPTASG